VPDVIALPLSGLRVIDCSRVLAGPFATMLLGDLGADVWKVEPPGGDESRGWGPPYWGDPADGRSAYFAAVNRNKRSIVVDLRQAAGQQVLDRLAGDARLLVHNVSPASATRLGLDAARLGSRHPGLLVAAVRGFDPTGPDAERPAYDLLVQAFSGLMAVTGQPDGQPTKAGVALLDLIAGLELAVGALAALAGGSRGTIDVSLADAGVTSLINVLGNHLATGVEPGRHGNRHPNIVPYETFAAADGELAIAVGNDAQFARLCIVLGLELEARFTTNAGRVAGRRDLVPVLAARIARWPRVELQAALAQADVPAAGVNRVSEALAAMRASGADGWTQRMNGIELPPSPIRHGGERLPVRLPPPRRGADTDAILAEAGYEAAEMAELRAAAVIA
jgi:crotonobetainyl-CoA:carnitine CoA-transferase CaiB-like acyl-CoA transferase